jgi:hypothetical protein
MANFAVLDGENILNTIVAESKAIAEEVTGKTCLEFTGEGVEPGGTYVGGVFISRKPYASWVLNLDNVWEAPVVAPEFDAENPKYYDWDEETTSWIEV